MWTPGDALDNSEDVIDSRDVIARMEELLPFKVEDTRIPESAVSDPVVEEFATEEEAADYIAGLPEDERGSFAVVEYSDESEELAALKDFARQGETMEDWNYGLVLVRDSYFTEYAKEFATEVGDVKTDMTWPYNHIDWEAAAEELQTDYTDIEFSGVTYWAR